MSPINFTMTPCLPQNGLPRRQPCVCVLRCRTDSAYRASRPFSCSHRITFSQPDIVDEVLGADWRNSQSSPSDGVSQKLRTNDGSSPVPSPPFVRNFWEIPSLGRLGIPP